MAFVGIKEKEEKEEKKHEPVYRVAAQLKMPNATSTLWTNMTWLQRVLVLSNFNFH